MCMGRQFLYVEEGTEIKDGKVTERDIKCENDKYNKEKGRSLRCKV